MRVHHSLFAAVFASAFVLLVTYVSNIKEGEYELLQSSTTDGSLPLKRNSLLQFQVPLTELEQTKVGEIVSGQVPFGSNNGGKVAFTGQVTSGYGTTASTGSLTVNMQTI